MLRNPCVVSLKIERRVFSTPGLISLSCFNFTAIGFHWLRQSKIISKTAVFPPISDNFKNSCCLSSESDWCDCSAEIFPTAQPKCFDNINNSSRRASLSHLSLSRGHPPPAAADSPRVSLILGRAHPAQPFHPLFLLLIYRSPFPLVLVFPHEK